MAKQFEHCSECNVPARYREQSTGLYSPYCPDCGKNRPLSSEGWEKENFPKRDVPDDFQPGGQFDPGNYKEKPLLAKARKDGTYSFEDLERANKANAERVKQERSGTNKGVSARYGLRPGDTPRSPKK